MLKTEFKHFLRFLKHPINAADVFYPCVTSPRPMSHSDFVKFVTKSEGAIWSS